MRAVFLALPVALAACAAGAPITPTDVTLRRDVLSVRFSDGQTCRAARPEGAAAWSGRFDGCGSYAYAVALEPGTNPARWVIEQVFAKDGGAPLVALGQVTLTDPARRREYVFVSPPVVAGD